jgi:transcriptional regulator with XRE-family HTH domain
MDAVSGTSPRVRGLLLATRLTLIGLAIGGAFCLHQDLQLRRLSILVNTKVLRSLAEKIAVLKAIREGRKMTLDDLARLTGYAKSTLSNVERGRFNPSPELVARIRDVFRIDPMWLDEAVGRVFLEDESHSGHWAREELEVRLDIFKRQISELDREIRRATTEKELAMRAAQSVARLLGLFTGSAATSLTDVHKSGQSTEVQRSLPALIERAKRATGARGGQAQLARALQVNRQSVSAWLAGETEPGGEMTLQLLSWVEQQEAQTKEIGSSSGETPPEPETQVRKSKHENQNPGPKKP